MVDGFTAGVGESFGEVGLGAEAGDGGGEGVGVAFGDEEAGVVVADEFGDGGVVGGDNGDAAGHGFHDGDGESFGVAVGGGDGGAEEGVAGFEFVGDAVLRDGAEELDAVFEAEAAGGGFEVLAERAVAGDDIAGVNVVFVAKAGERFEGDGVALLFDESADGEEAERRVRVGVKHGAGAGREAGEVDAHAVDGDEAFGGAELDEAVAALVGDGEDAVGVLEEVLVDAWAPFVEVCGEAVVVEGDGDGGVVEDAGVSEHGGDDAVGGEVAVDGVEGLRLKEEGACGVGEFKAEAACAEAWADCVEQAAAAIGVEAREKAREIAEASGFGRGDGGPGGAAFEEAVAVDVGMVLGLAGAAGDDVDVGAAVEEAGDLVEDEGFAEGGEGCDLIAHAHGGKVADGSAVKGEERAGRVVSRCCGSRVLDRRRSRGVGRGPRRVRFGRGRGGWVRVGRRWRSERGRGGSTRRRGRRA